MINSDSVDVQTAWRDLRNLLQRWGVKDFAASLLEAVGPLTIVGAQLAYLGQPFLASMISPDKFQQIVHLLEEPDQTKAFIDYLQEGDAA